MRFNQLGIIGITFVAVFFTLKNADAQTNSRNWVNINQAMIGAQPSMTSTAFSAFNSVFPFKYYSLAVGVNVTTTPWSVVLEGSNDQVSWASLVTNNSGTNPTGGVAFQSSAEPVLYLRVRASLLGSGEKITATAVGVP